MKGSVKQNPRSLLAAKSRQAALPYKSIRQAKNGAGSSALAGAVLCLPLILLSAAWPGQAAAASAVSSPSAQQQDSTSAAYPAAKLAIAAPYFKALPQTDDRASLGVNYYEAAGSPLTVTGRSGELLEALTPGGEKAYVPVWYTESAASQAKAAKPLILQLKPEARLHLFPGSQSSWPGNYAASGAISAIRSGDWYGVVLPADPGYAGGSVIRPSLLWVESSQVASTQQSLTGLMAADSTVPVDMVRSLTETSMPIGMPEEEVLSLLGKPYSKALLPHFSTLDPVESGKRGELWRYERSGVQLTVSLDTTHKLSGWNWILPTSEAQQAQVNANQPPYAFTYDFRLLAPVPSLVPNALWQAESNLDTQYLLAASEDALLIQEDDALASGEHREEGVYALDRSSGRRLWRMNAGSEGFDALFSADNRSALVLIKADPEQHTPILYHVRLNDGSILWSRPVESSGAKQNPSSLPSLSAAGTSAVLSVQPEGDEKGKLTVLAQRSGAVRWTKEFAEPYAVLNQGSDDPYVLVQQNRWIQALDSRTGKAVWSIKTDVDTLPNPYVQSQLAGGPRFDPFDSGDGTRWITFGGDWVRLNTSSGEILARYAISPNERVDMLNGRYLIVRRAVDAADYDSGSMFETKLYDTKQQQEVWSVPGKLSRALLDKDRIYGLLGGVPTALSLDSGQPLWKTPTSEFALAGPGNDVQAGSFVHAGGMLLLPYGPDLLTFDADTGVPLRRIDGAAFAYVESHARLLQNGALNRSGDTLYVGSSNGSFAAYDVDSLTKQIEQETEKKEASPNE